MNQHPFERYRPIIDDWEAFTHSVDQPLPRTLWLNPLKTSTPATLACDWEKSPCWPSAYSLPPNEENNPGAHWAYHAGLYHLQEIVSMLPVSLLNPQPGERILDLCAAPGSKTMQIALAMKNQGTLVANDKSYNRSKALRFHLERLGITNVSTTTYDGVSYPKAAGLFDKVLVDAPCSGEGTNRKSGRKASRKITKKNSSAYVQWKTIPNAHNVQHMQKQLLSRAINLCKPGGLIVYSTCTYAPEENENVVNTILEKHSDVELLPIHFSGFKTSPGITEWNGESFQTDLAKTARVWPHYQNTGGFYLALLQKKPASFDMLSNHESFEDADALEEFLKHTEPFNFSKEILENTHFFRVSKLGIYAINADHQPIRSPKPDASGLFVLKTHMQYPKLTTAGARLWGHLAQQQVVELNETQVEAYLNREEILISRDQKEACPYTGYVIVRYQNFGLGMGLLLHADKEDRGNMADKWLLKSLYPKT